MGIDQGNFLRRLNTIANMDLNQNSKTKILECNNCDRS